MLKEVLDRFGLSIKHMNLLDEFLRNHDPEYQRMEANLDTIGVDYANFCRELYYGGDKDRGQEPIGSRQMILSDIFQYILTGRMIYQASRSPDLKRSFVKISMYLVNEWLIMDCFGPREAVEQRRQLMNRLRAEMGDYFNEASASYHIEKFNEALEYDDDLIPNPPNPNPPSSRILSAYDSLFPKIRGGPIEILVYLYLVQRKLGFVTSLLIQQILLSGTKAVVPPDVFLLRRKGEVMGLEIGRGKERQSADFGLLTGIPTFSIDLAERQPFRCDGCGRWIIYCERVIEKYSEEGIPENHDHVLHCVECPHFDAGRCPDITCYIERVNRYDGERWARYHFRCLSSQEKDRILQNEGLQESLVAYLPLVEGLPTIRNAWERAPRASRTTSSLDPSTSMYPFRYHGLCGK